MSTIFSIYTSILASPGFAFLLKFLLYSSPVWAVLILGSIFWHIWLTYRRTKFINSQTYVLLEIKLPKEITKSPVAMEFLFNSMYQPIGEEKLKFKWYEKEWKKKISN